MWPMQDCDLCTCKYGSNTGCRNSARRKQKLVGVYFTFLYVIAASINFIVFPLL